MSKKENLEIMSQPSIEISETLKDTCPDLSLGIITADVVVEKKNEGAWDTLQEAGKQVESKYSLESLTTDSNLQAAREAYKKLGKDPTRYRVSSEALMRRVLQGKGLYQVNNIVDINNILSLERSLSSGAYDLSRINGDISFRVGKPGESYKGIGKEAINIAELPVFADDEGPYGSPTSDSEKAMITSNTNRAMIVLISFAGNLNGQLEEHMSRGKELLKDYAQGTNITTSIVS